MENIRIIAALVGVCIGLVGGIAALIAKYAKSSKAKKIAEGALEICSAILPFIKRAEERTTSGAEKKAYVMEEAEKYAEEHGIPFDAQDVSAKIDEYVALTKSVNAEKVSEENGVVLSQDEGNTEKEAHE